MVSLPLLAQAPLPEGPGKDAVVRVCTTCHGSGTLMRDKRDREHWQRTVEGMKARGAVASEADFKLVVDYLAAHFGEAERRQDERINVNRAAAWRIARDLKLSMEEGDALVAYREEHGDFKTLEDVAKVIDRAKIEAVKDRIVF